MSELVAPDIRYKQSYLEALDEYHADVANARRLTAYANVDREDLAKNFDKYIDQIRNEAQGIDLPEGYVPHSVYWLVEGDEYLGRVDIRHELNDFLKNEGGHIGYDIRPAQRNKGYGNLLLQLAIQKARELGIENILVTCDIDNPGSNKIIQKNGGNLENTYQLPNGVVKNRYWINKSA